MFVQHQLLGGRASKAECPRVSRQMEEPDQINDSMDVPMDITSNSAVQ
jgi:hypothetical protein